jgi:hypothetical protein
MATDKEKLDIIKNTLIVVLESDVIVDDNNSDAFKFGYLRGTINTIIEFINDVDEDNKIKLQSYLNFVSLL